MPKSCRIPRLSVAGAIFLLSTGLVLGAELAPPSENASVEQPPLEFPADSAKYKIISDSSPIFHSLMYTGDNISKSEAIDLLQNADLDQKVIPLQPILKKNKVEEKVNLKLDTELLQNVGATVDKDSYTSHGEGPHVEAMHPGKLAAMAVASILTLGAAVYIGVLVWRKALLRKYGSRQVLVNEEENERPSHFKHSVV